VPQNYGARICTVLVLTSLICPSGGRAQGLGALATQTAEERASSGRAGTPRITNADLDEPGVLDAGLRDFRLTEDGFWKYVRARSSLLELRTKTPLLDESLLGLERSGAGPLTIERRMIDDRRILDCLDRERIPPREYTVTEAAYHRARADASLSDAALDRLPPARAANVRFVRANDIPISNVLSQWADKQRWLDRQRRAHR
jgi:hypothetical protein